MLSKERIQEAEMNVKNYLKEGLLSKSAFKEIVFRVLRNNAKESLEVADMLAKENVSDLWVIVTSYYAMYYSANAVLYKLGYKVGEKISHKVTADSLIVFVRNKLKDALLEEYEEAQNEALVGIKADALLEDFDFERRKRSVIQYETKEFDKHSKAKTSLQRAKTFMFEMEKLLGSSK